MVCFCVPVSVLVKEVVAGVVFDLLCDAVWFGFVVLIVCLRVVV